MSKLFRRCQDTKLHEAIYNDEVQKVKYYLEKEVNINVPNRDGYTAFHAACVQQNAEIMDLLLQNTYMRVDTKLKTRVGDSALFLVLTGYCEKGSAKIVSRLIRHDIDLVEMADSRGFTPLQAAARWEQLDIVQLLITDGKAKVNRRDNDGWTALHHSADARPNIDVMEYLVNVAKVDISIRSNINLTAFDLLLQYHLDPVLLTPHYLSCVDFLSRHYLQRPDCHTFSTVLNFFQHCIIFERWTQLQKLITDFYNSSVNEKYEIMRKFIETFKLRDNPLYYAFGMVLNSRVKEINHFNYRQFEETFPDVLRDALQCEKKLAVFLDCLATIRELNSCSDKHILPHIAELDYNPCTVADIHRLFQLYQRLMDLDYKVDFNGIAFGYFLSFLSSGSGRKIRHLEIVLAFCTDNFVMLNKFCDTFNMQLNSDIRTLTYEADLPHEMKGPEYMPSLKELSRKIIRSAIYDSLLAKGRRLGLPPDLFYKNKYFVENILSLELPTVLHRYLRFMDRLP